MPGRFYSIPITGPTGLVGTGVGALVDLLEITAATGKPFYLHELIVGQTSDYGDAAAEGLGLQIKRGVGHTPGTGGQSVTPAKHDTSGQAAGATAKQINTTQATGGTITVLRAEPWNVQAGDQYLPTPETRFLFAAGEACIISTTLPADSLTVMGTAVIEEI